MSQKIIFRAICKETGKPIEGYLINKRWLSVQGVEYIWHDQYQIGVIDYKSDSHPINFFSVEPDTIEIVHCEIPYNQINDTD